MPTQTNCTLCKGEGYIDVLINQHGDEKEHIQCPVCKGKSIIYRMSDEDEQDYHDNYW